MKFNIIGRDNEDNKGKPKDHLQEIALLNKSIKHGNEVFMFIFLDNCGPCNSTKPNWDDIKNKINDKYKKLNNVEIVRINSDFIPKLQNIGSSPTGFPTLRHISKNGTKIEEYADSGISNIDRSTDSFIEWIEKHIKHKSTPHHKSKHHHSSTMQGGRKRSVRNRKQRKGYKKSHKKSHRKHKRSLTRRH